MNMLRRLVLIVATAALVVGTTAAPSAVAGTDHKFDYPCGVCW
jgi:hypothetical protein